MTPNNPNRKPKTSMINYNIVVLGSAGVGKSSMISVFTTGQFSRGYNPTIEEQYRKIIEIEDRTYRLHILDTMGHRDKAEILDTYTYDQQGFVIVFDLNNENSFEVAEKLAEKLSMMIMDEPIILVGNKSDSNRKITEEMTDDLVSDYNLRDYFECSASDDPSSVFNVFEGLLQHIIDDRPEDHTPQQSEIKRIDPSDINTPRTPKNQNLNSTISPPHRIFSNDRPTIIKTGNSSSKNSPKNEGRATERQQG